VDVLVTSSAQRPLWLAWVCDLVHESMSILFATQCPGKSLAYTRVEFFDPTGKLVAYGHHTKYVGKSSIHEKNIKFSEDGQSVVDGEEID